MYYNYNPFIYSRNMYKKPQNINRQNKHNVSEKCFNIGETAPDFTLTGIVNGEPKDVSLSQFKGKWVLLFFYGSDFTFV